MTMPLSPPPIGAEVYTSDGEKLGAVKEVRGIYFKVDAPMQRDYWLAADSLSGASMGGRVTTTFDKNHVDDHKQDIKDN